MTLRSTSFWLLGMTLSCVLVARPAVCQAPLAEGVLKSPKQACYSLAQDLKRRFPVLTQRPVYWVIGVDVSGSMHHRVNGVTRLDTVKEVLEDWVQHVAVPADKVHLVAFDDEVREFGPWQVGEDKAAFLLRLTEPLQVRSGRKGSYVETARRRVVDLAARADAAEPDRLVLSILLSDRFDNDERPGTGTVGRELMSRVGHILATSQETPDPEVVEGVKGLPIAVAGSGEQVRLQAYLSGARRAARLVEGGVVQGREVPLDPPQKVPDFEPADERFVMRLIYRVLPWIFLSLGLLLLAVLIRRPAGTLINKETNRGSPVPWWRPGDRQVHVLASHNRSGFCLDPKRGTQNDPVVMAAYLLNPQAFKGWLVRLHARDRYQVLSDDNLWDWKVDLAPGRERPVRVRESAEIAAGRVEFREDVTTRRLYAVCVTLLGLWLVSWLVAETTQDRFFPRPVGRPGYTITVKPL